MSTEPINISAKINASIQKVWDYYTMPQHITQWNFAHPSWHCPSASNDLRIGGQYVARMEARDGSFGFDFGGIYEEVQPLKRLHYLLGDGRKVNIEMEDNGDFCVVNIQFDPENINPIEMQEAGWQAILDNFKNYTETI